MTFIATVIAKTGAAIIADSLVTTSTPTIVYSDFISFLKEEVKKSKKNDIRLSPQEVMSLFRSRPSYTKDYEEKLFKYDDYTAVTTSGLATINDKRISLIVREIIDKNKKDSAYDRKSVETKARRFCKELGKEVKTHINKRGEIYRTRFIYTHFSKRERTTTVYKIDIIPTKKEELKEPTYECIKIEKADNYEKVISNGQNRISERILYGSIGEVYTLIPRLTEKIFKDFKINANDVPKNYISNLRKDKSIVSPKLFEEMQIFKLSELSLQQAVDLASLLMRIEIDFQTYTENIPTVGGVVKIAVIDENGFKYVSGNEVTKPINI